jgi:hypothetical protein
VRLTSGDARGSTGTYPDWKRAPQVNSRGLVLWEGRSAAGPALYLWDSAQVRQISDARSQPTDHYMQLNDLGHVAWAGGTGETYGLYLWDGSTIRHLSRLPGTSYLRSNIQMNNVGQVVWTEASGPDSAVSLWNGRDLVRLGPGGVSPRINDAGQVAWAARDSLGVDQIYLWSGSTPLQVGTHRFGGSLPLLSGSGHVLWWGYTYYYWWNGLATRSFTRTWSWFEVPVNYFGQYAWAEPFDSDAEVFLKEDTQVRRLTDNFIDDWAPQINDRGDVAWQSGRFSVNGLYLWNGSRIRLLETRLTAYPEWTLGQGGHVTWVAAEYPARMGIHLWDGTTIRQISNGDTSGSYPRVNRAGQVVWLRAQGGSADVYLYTPPLALAFSPAILVGGRSTTATLTLGHPSPTDVRVRLASSQPDLVEVAENVTVPAGATRLTFPVTTHSVAHTTDVVITAALEKTTARDTLTILPVRPADVVITPARAIVGTPVTGTLVLSDPAPAGGVTVPLFHSSPAAAAAPTHVRVPAGATHASFPIEVHRVETVTRTTFTAVAGGAYRTAALEVLPAGPRTVAIEPDPVVGGLTARGTVALHGPAPPGGLAIALMSENPAIVRVPVSVAVSAGEESTTFPVEVSRVAAVTVVRVKAASDGVSQAFQLGVLPRGIDQFILMPGEVVGGEDTFVKVILHDPAPSGGAALSLSSNRPDVALLSTTFKMLPGTNRTSFIRVKTSPPAIDTRVRLTATYAGDTCTVVLTVRRR